MVASFVLGSKASSMETRPPHHSAARTDLVLLIRRTVRPRGYASGFFSPAALLGKRRVLARQGWAGEKSDRFDKPAGAYSCVAFILTIEGLAGQHSFSNTC